jgi:phosphoribosylpyrophosphate synthetase
MGETDITTKNKKKLVLMSGRAHPQLAHDVAAELGTVVTGSDLRTFASGEIYARPEESVRGSDVFVMQSHCAPINEWLMEQLILVDSLKRASAKRITVVAPFYPYARQDKKGRGRELVAVGPDARVTEVIGVLKLHGVSQVPVVQGDAVVGVVTESRLLERALAGTRGDVAVRELVESSYCTVDERTDIATLAELFKRNKLAIVIGEAGKAHDIITRIDLIDYIAHVTGASRERA